MKDQTKKQSKIKRQSTTIGSDLLNFDFAGGEIAKATTAGGAMPDPMPTSCNLCPTEAQSSNWDTGMEDWKSLLDEPLIWLKADDPADASYASKPKSVPQPSSERGQGDSPVLPSNLNKNATTDHSTRKSKRAYQRRRSEITSPPNDTRTRTPHPSTAKANAVNNPKPENKSPAGKPSRHGCSGRRSTQHQRDYLLEQEPTAVDVLGGRGGGANNHGGNEPYWSKILELRPSYAATANDDTSGKNRIALQVLNFVKEERGGRFLAREKRTRLLYLMPDDRALAKIKQALRDKYVPLFARCPES